MSTEETIVGVPLPGGLDRDLKNARVLLEDPPWKDTPQKYRKMAEAILRRILTLDPDNESAKGLLIKAEAPILVAVPAPSRVPPATPPQAPVPVAAPTAIPEPSDLSFVAHVRPPKPQKIESSHSIGGLIGLVAATVIAGFLIFGFLAGRSKSESPLQPVTAAAHAVAPVSLDVTNEIPPAAPQAEPVVAEVQAPAPPAVVEVKTTAAVVAPMQMGRLAVSSPTTVDIYMGNQFLGSAPTTLEVPAGTQRLEYRHQDMRKIIEHNIKPDETTTLMVTFDVPVQINARPWAQVFIDGSQRQPLGQTPLSGVRVPIGSLLVFENPNFPGKTYRVTGKETEIRVNFP